MRNKPAGDLSLAESKNQYDDKVKRVLSNKIILAWILKYATEEFAIPMESKTMGEELNQMCNLSDYVEEIGIQKGIEQGIEKGIEQGIERGREQTLICQIEKKLAKGMAVPEIADALEETEETIRRLIDGMR